MRVFVSRKDIDLATVNVMRLRKQGSYKSLFNDYCQVCPVSISIKRHGLGQNVKTTGSKVFIDDVEYKLNGEGIKLVNEFDSPTKRLKIKSRWISLTKKKVVIGWASESDMLDGM